MVLSNGYKVKYFNMDEFKCPCCGEVNINEEFIEKLDKARYLANIPFKITSGYRCPKHNKEIGGSPTSSHMKGLAVDIACENSSDRYRIIEACINVGLKRLGIGENFIHIDGDRDKVWQVVWTYYKEFK
jgi:uncharacterized protein YcbK (DUF882 family)